MNDEDRSAGAVRDSGEEGGWKVPLHAEDAVPSSLGDVGRTFRGGCMSYSGSAYLNAGERGRETPLSDPCSVVDYRARAEASTTMRGSSPWMAGVRLPGSACWAARTLGASQRSPHARSSRAAGARPIPISVSE